MNDNLQKESSLKIEDDRNLIDSLCFLVIGFFLRNLTVEFSFLDDAQKSIISTIIKVAILLFLFRSVPVIVKRIDSKTILTIVIGCGFAFLHTLFFPLNNDFFISTIKTFVMTIFPGMVCAHLLRDYELFYERLLFTSQVISGINAMLELFLFKQYFISSESMGFSMSLIIPTNILLCEIIKNNKNRRVNLLLLLFNIITILVYGSRGAMIAVVMFAAILIVANQSYSVRKRAIITMVIMMASLFSGWILTGAAEILNDVFHVSSRTLELIRSNSLFKSNGRTEIWDIIWGEITEHPLDIRGINADRLLKTGYYASSNSSHSVILEMCYSFGIIFGGIICIYFFHRIVQTIRFNKTKLDLLRLIYLFSFFPICLWSGSIWESCNWWIWLVL